MLKSMGQPSITTILGPERLLQTLKQLRIFLFLVVFGEFNLILNKIMHFPRIESLLKENQFQEKKN